MFRSIPNSVQTDSEYREMFAEVLLEMRAPSRCSVAACPAARRSLRRGRSGAGQQSAAF